MPTRALERSRSEIARKVRELRLGRRWTQAELAGRLDLSQSRLSEIERGAGSFTAEQFLAILRLFNIPASHFARDAERDETSALQNALARLGSTHLHEDRNVIPSERLEEVASVLREAILSGEPRFITAASPLLVYQADYVGTGRVEARLAESGLDRRLAWIAENTMFALEAELRENPSVPWSRLCRRAAVVLPLVVERVASRTPGPQPLDIVDRTIRSEASLTETRRTSSEISRRWGIVSALTPEDFHVALRAARVGV